jgi:hypothetical protein
VVETGVSGKVATTEKGAVPFNHYIEKEQWLAESLDTFYAFSAAKEVP